MHYILNEWCTELQSTPFGNIRDSVVRQTQYETEAARLVNYTIDLNHDCCAVVRTLEQYVEHVHVKVPFNITLQETTTSL
jgi:hypothetical protein